MIFNHLTYILNIGFPELLLVGGILILVFGASQIPKIARSLGEGLKEFKKAIKDSKAPDDAEKSKIEQEARTSYEPKH